MRVRQAESGYLRSFGQTTLLSVAELGLENKRAAILCSPYCKRKPVAEESDEGE